MLTEAGYVVLAFDYKGWGRSEGPRARLAPFGRVADALAALTFLQTRPGVEPARLGLYGTSYGGATVVWAAALDERVRCVVSVVGVGDGRRWMRSVRRPDEWHDLLERAREDREQAVLSGESALAERDDILLQDRASAALSAAARAANPDAVSTVPTSFIDETLSFHADWVVGRIAPRPLLLVTTEDDRLVPPEESRSLYEHARRAQEARGAGGLRPLRRLCRARLRRGDGGDAGVVSRAPAGAGVRRRAGGVAL